MISLTQREQQTPADCIRDIQELLHLRVKGETYIPEPSVPGGRISIEWMLMNSAARYVYLMTGRL